MLKKGKSRIGVILCVSLLVLIEIGALFLMYKSSSNRSLDEVSLNKVETTETFAILVEQSDGTYKELDGDTKIWPTDGYKFNATKSGCIDVNGNRIEGVLSYDSSTNIATVDTAKTSYCYLYFDIKGTGLEIGQVNMSSELIGDLYRYQGSATTVTNNYICFGTSSTDACTTNTENYMYRIIGITEDGSLKLIKNEALQTSYSWQTDATVEVSWPSSNLYSELNGTAFLANATYVPNETWSNKIKENSWKYGNITSYEGTAASISEIESSFTTTSAKIGLMSLSDYYYQSESNNCSESGGTYSSCKNGWMGLTSNTNNDIEWTMSAYGIEDSSQKAYAIHSDGYVYYETASKTGLVRPVFYLNNDIEISGEGTSTSPYIIAE